MLCRHCATRLPAPFLDLGFAPPSNAYLTAEELDRFEVRYPLRLHVCPTCWLVQTRDYSRADELFTSQYAYFSSTSTTWLAHARQFAIQMQERLGLGPQSKVIEVASNDGYLLQYFLEAGIPCFGVEPTESTARAAEARGVTVRREFMSERFGRALAAEGETADLVVGNNVLAHVPDIVDFVRGLAAVLKPSGTLSLEFPHLLQLLTHGQFDTVYHEHFSYLSLHAVGRILERCGLMIEEVQPLTTHGGSLRVLARHLSAGVSSHPSVASLMDAETRGGLESMETYEAFARRPPMVARDLVGFLSEQARLGVKVAGYGAAAKGNTLLNYAGINTLLLSKVYDAAPSKQGKFLPGSHIPIAAPSEIERDRPALILILPWNIRDEVMTQLAYVREWGARFVTAVPRLEVIDHATAPHGRQR